MPALKEGGGGGGAVVKPKPPDKPPIKALPKVYWFNGKSYIGLAAYQAAVAAAKPKPVVVPHAAVPDPVAAPAPVVAVPAAPVVVPHAAQQEAAAAAAAEAVAKQQAFVRAQALAAKQLAADVAKKAAEKTALLSAATADAAERGQVAAAAELKRRMTAQMVVQQRQVAVAAARKKAYDYLQEQVVQQRLARERGLAKGQREITRDEIAAAGAYRGADRKSVGYAGTHFYESAGDKTRREVVAKGEKTGDWSDAISTLDDQSRATGGRYVDEKLVGEVYKKYVIPVQKVGDDFQAAVAEFDRLQAAGDIKGMIALLDDPKFKLLLAQFEKLYGKDGKPGTFAATARVLENLRVQREKLWIATLSGASPFATDVEIERLYNRAMGQTLIDTEHGLSGMLKGPLVYRDTVFDPVIGKNKVVVRRGLDAWQAREQAEAQEREITRYRKDAEQIMKWNLIEKTPFGRGYHYERSQVTGELLVTNPADERLAREMVGWVSGGVAMRMRIAKLSPFSAQREQLVRDYMAEAERGYDRHHPRPAEVRGGAATAAGGRAMRVQDAYDRERSKWLNSVWSSLGKEGTYGALERGALGPVGFVLSSLLTGGAAIIGGAGLLENKLFGGHLTISGPRSDMAGNKGQGSYHGWEFGFEGVDQAKTDKLQAALDDPSGDLGTRAAALREYAPGSLIGGGMGQLLEGFLDPLNYVGPGMLMKPARLAIAEAGGRAALGSFEDLGRGLAAFKKYMVASPQVVRQDLAKLALGRTFGMAGHDALAMTDDMFRDMVGNAARKAADLKKIDGFKALADRAGLTPDQLSSIIQQKLPAIAKEYKILAESPFEAIARMKAAKAAYVRAGAEAEQAAKMAAEAAEREAWEAAAKESVKGIPEPRSLTVKQLEAHAKALAGYQEVTRQYLEAAQRGVRAAEEIASGAAKADRGRLATLQVQLRRAEKDVIRFEDKAALDPDLPAELGVVGKALKRVRESERAIGGSPMARSVTDTMRDEIRHDAALVNRRILAVSSQIKRAKTPAARATLQARYRSLLRVKESLVFQKKLLSSARDVAAALTEKDMKRIAPAIKGRKIAVAASGDLERTVAMGRDVRARHVGSDGVRPRVDLSDDEATAFATVRKEMVGQNPPDVASVRHFLDSTGPLNLQDAWEVLYRITRSELGYDRWGEAFRAVNNAAMKVMGKHGITGKANEVAGRLWGVVSEARVGTAPLSISEFAVVDKDVAAALRKLRGFAAEGQVRLRGGELSTNVGGMILRDDDPLEILAVMEALAPHGLTVHEYDEMRGVLSDLMIKENVEKGILNRIRKLPGWSEFTQAEKDAAFLAERDIRLDKELRRNFEEFAARAENAGLGKAMLLRRFEERFVARQLGAGGGYKLSQFQLDSLERSFREQAGFSMHDRDRAVDFLQGRRPGVPTGGRLVREGEMIAIEGADMSRVFVVPLDHEMLTDHVPFARPRGDELPPAAHIREGGTSEVSTTHGILTKPASAKEATYELWVWHQMNSGFAFRQRIWKIGRDPAGFDKLFAREEADVLSRALNWMKTPAGKRHFGMPERGPVGPHAIGQAASRQAERAWREPLEAEQVAMRRVLGDFRERSGLAFQVRPEKQWLMDIAEVIPKGYAGGEGGNLVERLGALIRGGSSKVADWVDVVELKRLRAAVDELGIASVDDLLKGRKLPKRFWSAERESAEVLPEFAANFARAQERLDAAVASLRAGPVERARGRVGLSVGEDAAYIAEGTSNVTLAHEVFHQWWDDAANASWVGDISRSIDLLGPGVRAELWGRIRIGIAAYDPDEFAAELYALWRVGDAAGSDVRFAWRDLQEVLAASPDPALAGGSGSLAQLGKLFDSYSPKMSSVVRPLSAPPLHSRGLMGKWFVEQGIWSQHTLDEIYSDARAWNIDEEAALYERLFAHVPAWADREVVLPLLDDPQAMAMAKMEWGFGEGGADQVMSGMGLTAKQSAEGVAWGVRAPDGTLIRPPKLSFEEVRQRAIERYGDMISSDGETLTSMPQLMRVETRGALPWVGSEYDLWTRSMFDPVRQAERKASWLAARARLPKIVESVFFDGDEVAAAGLRINRSLVKDTEMQRLGEVFASATRRKFERLAKMGDLPSGDWLPQEQMAFAQDILQGMMDDPGWRGLLRRTPVAGAIVGAALRTWGHIFRLLVAWQPAFPLMNLIDSYGFKRAYLIMYENGGRALAGDVDGMMLVRDINEIDASANALFGLHEGVRWFSPGAAAGNRLSVRAAAIGAGLRDLPMSLSALGENQLRLDFARSVAGRTYRGALADGMDEATAAAFSRLEARRMINVYFAQPSGSALETALNELVPFLSYNFRNKLISLKIVASHPSIWLWGHRLQMQIEKMNREAWERDNPGVEMPDEKAYKQLWFEIGGQRYSIDLAGMSDWTRGIEAVTKDQTLIQFAQGMFRVPHPEQLALWAWMTGGNTPWGKPGDLREMSFWVDLWRWTHGEDYAKRGDKRDVVQMWGQILFFKKFGRLDPIKVKLQTFFGFSNSLLGKEMARAYLDQNPDLQLYFDEANGGSGLALKWLDGKAILRRGALLSDAEHRQYDADYAGWQALNNRLDRDVAELAAEPWSAEYRAAKKRASIERQMYLSDHPDMVDYWGIWMSPAQFAADQDSWRVDELADSWFAWERPVRANFTSDLAFQRALVANNQLREDYLLANPALAQRLYGSASAVEYAWHQQELHWTEILDFTARLKLDILENDAKGARADPDLKELLYRVKGIASESLDAPAYDMVFGGTKYGSFLSRFAASATTALAAIPGFGSQRYANATPAERLVIDADNRYFTALREVAAQAKSGKEFYDLMRQRGMLDEYFKRNPGKKEAFEAGKEYFRWISSWVDKLQADDFVGAQAVWDAMPAWAKNRYFAKHPDSGMRDGMGGGGGGAVQWEGQWFKSIESRDRFIAGSKYFNEISALFNSVDSGLEFWAGLKANPTLAADYFGRHPDRRPAYDAWLSGATFDVTKFSSERMPLGDDGLPHFTSDESRARFEAGQQYFAKIGGWIDLLEARDFVAADIYFRAMPQWMKEKYWDKHPDQRAKGELDSEVLRRGAEYFLASGDDKLNILARYPQLQEWLAEHGGEEAAFRGLINAMYRAIPQTEQWLRRTFRERFPEIFSKEAAGERALAAIAKQHAQHPEMVPFYDRALRLQQSLYTEQLKRSKVPPKPWSMVRKRRLQRKSRRRMARMNSHWSTHKSIRAGAIPAGAGG